MNFLGTLRPPALAYYRMDRAHYGGFGMAYSVTFKRGDQVLERYEFEVENPDDIRAHVDEAHIKFRKAHPNISIFDGGVTVHYDKD